MTFGLKVNDAAGGNILNTDTFTYTVIYSAVITLTSGQPELYITIPGFDPANCVFLIYHERPDLDGNFSGPHLQKLIPYIFPPTSNVIRVQGSRSGWDGNALNTQFRVMALRMF